MSRQRTAAFLGHIGLAFLAAPHRSRPAGIGFAPGHYVPVELRHQITEGAEVDLVRPEQLFQHARRSTAFRQQLMLFIDREPMQFTCRRQAWHQDQPGKTPIIH